MTVGEMPSHSHEISLSNNGEHTHKIRRRTGYSNSTSEASSWGCGMAYSNGTEVAQVDSQSAGTHTHDVTVNNAGGNTAHNNIQPYISVYIWRRTA